MDHWMLFGYDEFGPLWMCSKCRGKRERGEPLDDDPDDAPPEKPISRSG